MATDIDTVIVGAGHAGLNASRALQLQGIEHVVLERGRVGQTWRAQRWDTFRLNTPGFANSLLDGPDFPDGFGTTDDLIDYFEQYVHEFSLPVHEETSVDRIERVDDGFIVHTSRGEYRARNVIACSGGTNVPAVPFMAGALAETIDQLHSADYRSADALADGAVLVVGAAQSGAQIAEDLIEAGRDVYLCTSKVGRVPRRHRGRDLMEWTFPTPMVKQRPEDLPDPAMQYAAQPRISGTRGGHTLCLHQFARDGATLLGRLEGLDGARAQIAGDLADNVAFADATSQHVRGMLDQMIEAMGVEAEPAQPDPAEEPFDISEMAEVRELDLAEAGITTVIWATGFRAEFPYLEFDLELDQHGDPAHDDGASPVEGVYFLGLPWLRTRSSGLILGNKDDALHVAEQISARQSDGRRAG